MPVQIGVEYRRLAGTGHHDGGGEAHPRLALDDAPTSVAAAHTRRSA
jgi:hypothetical protein